jgi:hypothetical protein
MPEMDEWMRDFTALAGEYVECRKRLDHLEKAARALWLKVCDEHPGCRDWPELEAAGEQMDEARVYLERVR